MIPSASHTAQVNPAEVDLEQLFNEQSDAQAAYELVMIYKSFGFREKAIMEFYRLCDQRTVYAEQYADTLAPMLFN